MPRPPLAKSLLPLVLLALAAGSLLAFSGSGFNPTTAQLIPTPTLGANDYVYAILTDTNTLLYCSVVREPLPDVFLTATAAPTRTPTPTATATTVSLATKTAMPIWITPEATSTFPTPTEEYWQVETQTTPTMTVIVDALNVRSCAGKACGFVRAAKRGETLAVTSVTKVADGFVWRMLTSGEWAAQEVVNGAKYMQ